MFNTIKLNKATNRLQSEQTTVSKIVSSVRNIDANQVIKIAISAAAIVKATTTIINKPNSVYSYCQAGVVITSVAAAFGNGKLNLIGEAIGTVGLVKSMLKR